jgi:ComF family protein
MALRVEKAWPGRRDLWRAARDLLVPPRCAGCGAAAGWFCDECRGLCDPSALSIGRLRVRGAGIYAGPLREAIQRFKYRQERALAAELGSLIAGCVAEDLAKGGPLDAVVPVPLHPSRAAERGYDQARLLAEAAAAETALPLRRPLRRVRRGRPQVELDRDERTTNVAGAFVADAGSLRGLRVALVDDVATTGATLNAAATAAREAGARQVRAYVAALDA